MPLGLYGSSGANSATCFSVHVPKSPGIAWLSGSSSLSFSIALTSISRVGKLQALGGP